MWKCLDQIQRELLYEILDVRGFPLGILAAYRNFHKQVQYLNTIGTGLGDPHFETCGIPTGCAVSMPIISLNFTPWAHKMGCMKVTPRCRVDDLMAYAIGEDHERIFQVSYTETLRHPIFTGVKQAPTKCFTFSTEHLTRFSLSQELGWSSTYVNVVPLCKQTGGTSLNH